MKALFILKRRWPGEASEQPQHSLPWFLLFWVVFIYGQYLFDRLVTQYQGSSQRFALPSITDAAGNVFFPVHLFFTFSLPSIIVPLVVTGLMVLHGSFHWLALFKSNWSRWLWLYFALQLLCIFCIATIAEADNVGYADDLALGLSLILVMETFYLCKPHSMIILLATSALVFGIVMQGLHLQREIQMSATVDLLSLGLKLVASTGGSTLLPCVCASIIIALNQSRARQRDQKLLCELKAAQVQLADYAAQVQELTLTTERQRMARELHDTLAQGLVGLKMQLETIDALLEQQEVEPARGIVQQAMKRARAALSNARAVITDLRSEPQGELRSAITAEAEHFSQITGVPCSCSLNIPLPDKHHEQMLRLVSEALTNISRHAQASRAWIRTYREQGDVLLEVGDNGIGFEPTQVAAGHYGLAGLRERAKYMGGQLQLRSERKVGTTIVLRLAHEVAGEA